MKKVLYIYGGFVHGVPAWASRFLGSNAGNVTGEAWQYDSRTGVWSPWLAVGPVAPPALGTPPVPGAGAEESAAGSPEPSDMCCYLRPAVSEPVRDRCS